MESLEAMAAVELAEGYGWVVVVLIASIVIVTWMATMVSGVLALSCSNA